MRTTLAEPSFKRPEVAILLRCSSQTVRNREDRGVYPKPSRDYVNHRVYSLADVFELMYLTENHIYLEPIVSMLYEKGYTDKVDVQNFINQELQRFQFKTAVTKEQTILHE